jgi:phosphoserine phosphatase RsbU/P
MNVDFLTRRKILIAEDDNIASKVLKHALEHLGHEVIVTNNGQTAWEAFDCEPVRIIVSDWMMPGLDGLELCAKIRSRTKTPYTYFILLTSAETTPENYDFATDAGVDDFLPKPLDRSMIRMRLRVADRIFGYTTEIRQLRDLIPMCTCCLKIRDDGDYWERVDTYIRTQTGTRFSHGICPDCLAKEMAKLEEESTDVEAGESATRPDGGS